MLDSKTLSLAVGVQRQSNINATQDNSVSAISTSVVVGRFKRGRMDKAFRVNSGNFQALLGSDAGNPSYDAVEDVLALGVAEVWVVRIGDSRHHGFSNSVSFNIASLISSDKPNNLRLGSDGKLVSLPPDVDFLAYYIAARD
jgi:hypothetical protein